MVKDTSKFLHFRSSAIRWEDLTDRTKLREFVETLKKCKLQASGIIQKLDYLEDALKFYRICIVRADSTQAEKTSEIIRNWRSVLRKDKGMAHIHNMEVQSDGGRTTIKQACEPSSTDLLQASLPEVEGS